MLVSDHYIGTLPIDQEHSNQIDVDDSLGGIDRHNGMIGKGEDAGIAMDHVDSAKGLNHLCDHRLDIFLPGHVGTDRYGFDSESRTDGLCNFHTLVECGWKNDHGDVGSQ